MRKKYDVRKKKPNESDEEQFERRTKIQIPTKKRKPTEG